MSFPPSSEPDLDGTVLGRYRLGRRLGVGGMGTVYAAQHELLERRAAIKVLHGTLSAKPNARKRFLREARAASRVQHENVVEIFDVAFSGNHVFFVMELLEGRDLAQRLEADGRIPWAQAAPILIQVVAGLAAAHSVGVIHRDIKPSNCFLVPDRRRGGDRVKVVDFGIAKVAHPEHAVATEELTAAGEIFGTANYMAPEMAEGPTNDPRSDIYELGVLMFRVLTGRLPFEGAPLQVLTQHITKAPPSPRSFEPSIPVEVERIILRALEKLPDDRQASMQQLGVELRRAAGAGEATDAGGASAQRPASKPRSRPAASTPRPRSPAAALERPAAIGLDARPEPRPQSSRNPQSDPWRDVVRGRTSMYGDQAEPPPPPMPGEPDPPQHTDVGITPPPGAFGPPPDARLELDLPTDGSADDGITGRRHRSPGWRRWPVLLGMAAVVGAAVAAWNYRDVGVDDMAKGVDELVDEVGLSSDAEPVLLLVDTKPKDARVYIDDERRSDRPIRLPRSDEYVRVRVEAEGYEPRVIQVKPSRSRQLEVKLDRASRR